MDHPFAKSFYISSIVFCLIAAASFFKIAVWGHSTTLLSLSHCLLPLMGIYFSIHHLAGVCAFRFLIKKYFLTSACFVMTYHTPTLCATLYYTYQQSRIGKYIAALIPLTCMLLFVTDPIGSQVWYYSLYWLIPLATTIVPHRSFFMHALGSTFTAHAVGSLFWLKAGLLTAPQWQALIPVVCFERLICALAMTLTWHVIEYVRSACTIAQRNPTPHPLFNR